MSDFIPKAVIFDMDGVLLDSESICDQTWKIAGETFGIPNTKTSIQKCRGCNKTDTELILKEIYGQDFNVSDFLNETSRLFHQIEEKNGIPLMFYAKEILEYLTKKYPLGLASSTRKITASRQMKTAGLYDFFKTFTFGDMVSHSKPSPDIYVMACKSLDVSAENCVAVEDSPNGVKSAFDAGMKVIMVPDKIQPDDDVKKMTWKICKNLKEIENIL